MHRNIHDTVYNVENYIVRTLRELRRVKMETLLDKRYQRLRSMGSSTASSLRQRTKIASQKIKAAVDAIGKKPQPAKSIEAVLKQLRRFFRIHEIITTRAPMGVLQKSPAP